MCTVLQQHLQQQQMNGYHNTTVDGRSSSASGGDRGPGAPIGHSTPSNTSQHHFHHHRHVSPVRYEAQPLYSYLNEDPSAVLKRPIDQADRKISTPAMHFHLPAPDPVTGSRSRAGRSTYISQLYGRSRSHSRTGMRVLVEQIHATAPRPKSPHMNNEEPIELSHYPDGRPPEEREDKETPIERDDFPAPPFAYSDPRRRRRHWSAPGASEETPEQSDEEEKEAFQDPQLDKEEEQLRKISTGMGKVFLTEIAIERERRKSSRSRPLDPRSAARTPNARKEPHFRLRYDSPINASPSRIADHCKPWDEDGLDGTISRGRTSGMGTPAYHLPIISPINPPRPGYTQGRSSTLPFRLSPGGGYDSSYDGGMGDKTYSTDFSSKSDISDKSLGEYDHHRGLSPQNGENIRVSTTYTAGMQTAQTVPARGSSRQQRRSHPQSSHDQSGSLPNVPSGSLQAPNVYPLHLLMTTNYRLPGDVDRVFLEKHLSDAEFDVLFKCSRQEFYQMPYWKRCELKKRYHLF